MSGVCHEVGVVTIMSLCALTIDRGLPDVQVV